MKKYLAIALVVAMLIISSLACNGDDWNSYNYGAGSHGGCSNQYCQ